MAKKTSNGVLGQLVSRLLGGKDRKENRQSIAQRGVLPFNRKPWHPFWLELPLCPSRTHKGQSALLPHEWPDKEKYGRDDNGTIRRRVPKLPFRVRRWRKRAAARIAREGGHSLQHGQNMAAAIEKRIVGELTKKTA